MTSVTYLEGVLIIIIIIIIRIIRILRIVAKITITRALLRLERTMNLLEGVKGGEGRVGERGRGGEGRGGEGRGGEGRGGMTVIHILIGMFNSNPMIPQHLNNNLT